MHIALIPRVRVNYSFKDLLRAFFVSGRKNVYRNRCQAFFFDFFGEEAVLLPSGRSALYELLLRLPQAKVVLPAYTCMAVVEAAVRAKKEIVFVRSLKDSFNADYLEAITGDCIVVATHQYGLPCDIEAIVGKSRAVGAVVVEDCAAALGTVINGRKAGTFGDYAFVSFNASKLLNVPPYGGVLVGRNTDVLHDIRDGFGHLDAGFRHKCIGLFRGIAFVMAKNVLFYRLFHRIFMDTGRKGQSDGRVIIQEEKPSLYRYGFAEWQAYILYRQLLVLDNIMQQRKELYSIYDRAIVNPSVKKPPVDGSAVCTRYTVRLHRRDDFYDQCTKKGVDMDFSHYPIGCPTSFEEEHELSRHILNLPFYYNMTDSEIRRVIAIVNSIVLR